MSIAISGRSVRVTANGLHHHLLAYGKDEGDAIVILPGITSPAATADFVAAPLAALGYRVFVPDLRGRGETDVAPAGHYRLSDYAADVAGLVEMLNLDQPTILGHSLGARIAAAYAVTYGGENHGSLILVDPPTSGPGRGAYPMSRESFLAQLHQAQRGTTADEIRKFYPKWPLRELQLRAEQLASCDETAVIETHEGFESEDFCPIWKALTRPATVIRGELSPVVSAAAAADLAKANPNIPIVGVPDAGHMVPWDNFVGFFKVIVRLLPHRASKH
ncbi:MAG: alpha/beta hydrolase [Bradyrhizobium sp.]|nr:alpha/beta hydrolase [Bradyrhizobium sp.]